MERKLRVGILGATGMVGQRFISLLENHPWFEVVTVAASPRSEGKTYEEAVGDRWKMQTPMPESVKSLVVMNVNEVEKVAAGVDFVFSAVDMSKEEIKAIEEAYAKTETPVVSNNSAHRWTKDVPMVIPEINPEHFEIIEAQKARLGTERGFVAVKPNCSIQSYAPVHEAKAATQYTQQVNQNYAKSLPFSDRQDFDDAQRGFIAPLLDEGILRDANGKPYYRGEDYKFDINAPAPETVNPSLWRQSQLNGISGLFKVTDRMYQVRGQDISNITFIEGDTGIIVIDPLVTPPSAKYTTTDVLLYPFVRKGTT